MIEVQFDIPSESPDLADLKLAFENARVQCLVTRDRLVIATARLAKSRDAIDGRLKEHGSVQQSWIDLQNRIVAEHNAAVAELTDQAIAFVDAAMAWEYEANGHGIDEYQDYCQAWGHVCRHIEPPVEEETHTGILERDVDRPPSLVTMATQPLWDAFEAAGHENDSQRLTTSFRHFVTAYVAASWPVLT